MTRPLTSKKQRGWLHYDRVFIEPLPQQLAVEHIMAHAVEVSKGHPE